MRVKCVKDFFVYDLDDNEITFKAGNVYELEPKGPAAGWPMIKCPEDGEFYDITCEEKDGKWYSEDNEVYLVEV